MEPEAYRTRREWEAFLCLEDEGASIQSCSLSSAAAELAPTWARHPQLDSACFLFVEAGTELGILSFSRDSRKPKLRTLRAEACQTPLVERTLGSRAPVLLPVDQDSARILDNDCRYAFVIPVGTNSHRFVLFLFDCEPAPLEALEAELCPKSYLLDGFLYPDFAQFNHFKRTIRLLPDLVVHRNLETGLHLLRITAYARLIAERLVARNIKRAIELYAPLHDIGKLAIPDSILLKPGRLTEREYESIRKHPELGFEIIETVVRIFGGDQYLPYFDTLRAIVLHHHETMDGNGYPHGLQGAAIPIEARVVAVADVFDALTGERPYKQQYTIDQAFSELNRLRGTKLDPDCVDAFVSRRAAVEDIFTHPPLGSADDWRESMADQAVESTAR